MTKPDPIRVGVQGFVAFEAKPGANPCIDWSRLAELPPFGMFLAECHAGQEPQPSIALFDEYCQWHKAKGYWPNETPTGELLPVSDNQMPS